MVLHGFVGFSNASEFFAPSEPSSMFFSVVYLFAFLLCSHVRFFPCLELWRLFFFP